MLGVLVMQGSYSSQEGGSDIINKSQVLGLMSSVRSVAVVGYSHSIWAALNQWT